MNWEDSVVQSGRLMEWPYPVRYDIQNDMDTDVLILGGGPAGCMAAISAAKNGLRVCLLDKAHPKRSGGGSGFDHWLNTPNPCSQVTAEDCVEWEAASYDGYSNSLSRYIAAREAYDTLLELETIGAKIRDTDDDFKGAPYRDERTRFLFCYDYDNRFHFRVWGTTFKPAMYKECRRLGVQVFDRVVATSLLTEGGKQGTRVVGATGLNARTGEFYVFKAKATVLALSCHQRSWGFSSELIGLDSFRPNVTGDGPALAWRAGAELTQMEKAWPAAPPGHEYPQYGTGNWHNTWYATTIVDANGKEIPWVDANGKVLETVEERYRPAVGQRFGGERGTHPLYSKPTLIKDLYERIKRGEYALPLYADLASMPWYERKSIWGMMVGEEARTRVPIYLNYEAAGFDASKHLLQSYVMLGGETTNSQDPMFWQSCFRRDGAGDCGSIVVDWDLKTTLDGLYAAGDILFAGNYYYHACVTGRYAGRKAAEYALTQRVPVIDQKQVKKERTRVYGPTVRSSGRDWIDWKELRAGCARAMQNYCGGFTNEGLLTTGLNWLKDIENNAYPEVYAGNPHILLRVLETYNTLTCDQVIVLASLARKASSDVLGHHRLDFPEKDPPEWHKFITLKQTDGQAKAGELPIGFWGGLSDNYEAHNRRYRGYLKSK
jgi:succinate dehydrogenase/fumarate reductase flavoprotein subunit